MRTSLTQTHTQKTKTKKTHRASSQNSSLNRKYLHYSRGKACYRLAIQNSIDALFSALFLVVLIHSTGWKAKATTQTRKKVLKEKQAFLSAMVCPDKNWRKQWILNTVLYLLPLTSSLRRMVLFSTSVLVDIIHCWIILKNSLGTTLKKKKKNPQKVTPNAPHPRIFCPKDTFVPSSRKTTFSTPDAGDVAQAVLLTLWLWVSLSFANNLWHICCACALQILYFLMIFAKENRAQWGEVCPHKSAL